MFQTAKQIRPGTGNAT